MSFVEQVAAKATPDQHDGRAEQRDARAELGADPSPLLAWAEAAARSADVRSESSATRARTPGYMHEGYFYTS